MLHLLQALRPIFPLSEIVVLLFFPFERHAELNSKSRPLGTVFTCSKIKRSLLNLFVVAALCFEKSADQNDIGWRRAQILTNN